MLPRGSGTFCLQLILALAGTVAFARAQKQAVTLPPGPSTLVLNDIGKGSVPLNGPWQFHLGDDISWASPALDDSHWEQLSADKPWGEQGHFAYTGFAWYRRALAITPAPGASPDIALFVPHINDAYEIYWNGALIGHHGKFPPHPVWYGYSTPQTFGMGPARLGVLAIRVWTSTLTFSSSSTSGGFTAPIELGSPEAISNLKAKSEGDRFRDLSFSFPLYSLYALFGFFALILWLRNRVQLLFFFAAGFLMPVGIGAILNLDQIFSDRLQGVIGDFGTNAENIALWFLLCWLLDLRQNQKLMHFTRVVAAVLAVITVFTILFYLFWFPSLHGAAAQVPDAFFLVSITISGFWSIVPITVAIFGRRNLNHSRWLFALTCAFAQTIFVLSLSFALGQRFTHLAISDFAIHPLFRIGGANFCLQNLSDALLLLALIYAIYRFSVESRERQTALEQEFLNARELQQVLIPESLPEIPGFALTSAYKPALEVGGDFFQVFPLESPSASTLIVVGDVSGKGLKAAMAVSLLVGAIRTAAETTSSPAQILAALNRRLDGRLNGGFATCIALRLDAGGDCVLACAGHPAPVVNGLELDLPGALPLGLTDAASYQETTFHLRANDHCALYTDGLLEARNPSGELFGFHRLTTLFSAQPTAAQATEAAVAFGQDDDITVLTLTRLADLALPAVAHRDPALVIA
jgi:hypothetical protein